MIEVLKDIRNNNKMIDYLNKFFNSNIYLFSVMVFSLLSWKLRTVWIVVVCVVILFWLINFFKVNKSRIFPLIIFFFISLRGNTSGMITSALIFLGITILPIIIYDLVNEIITTKKDNSKVDKSIFVHPIFLAMFLVLISMIFSIVNAPNQKMPFYGILYWVSYMVLFLYFLIIKKSSNNLDNDKMYIARNFIMLGIAIFIQIFLFFLENYDGMNVAEFFGGKSIHLSWANPNLVASVYLIVIPFTGYYFIKNQKLRLFVIFIALELFSLLLLLSRSAYLGFLVSSIPLLILVIKSVKDRMKFVKTMIISVIIAEILLIAYFIPNGLVKSFFDILNQKGISLVGREALFNIGLSVFTRYPLFGGGINTAKFYLSILSSESFYHNYIIETLANIGIIGLVAFVYYLYQVIRRVFYKDDFNNYVGIIMLSLLIQGLFDTTFYHPIVMILLSIVLPMLA